VGFAIIKLAMSGVFLVVIRLASPQCHTFTCLIRSKCDSPGSCQIIKKVAQPTPRLNKTRKVRTYNVTVRRVRATIVAVEKQILHILSVCL